MIYSSLLVPHESPTTPREVKRALLSYDRSILVDPADRDFMPSNAVMAAIMGIPIFGISTGPARPMSKAPEYDTAFEQLIEMCRPAIEQGLIEVRSTYTKSPEGRFTLGGIDMGGYPLDTRVVFWLYRSMAANQPLLESALEGTPPEQRGQIVEYPGADGQGTADGSINNIPALPTLDVPIDDESTRTALTNIARARIGAIIKYSGYCEARELIPVASAPVYGHLVQRILENARAVLRTTEDPHWYAQTRVLQLCHEEFLSDEELDSLSIEQTIRLRTTAWGDQARARERLFQDVFAIARETGQDAAFEERASKLIRDYRVASEGLLREREKLHFKIKCEIGTAILGSIGAHGLLSQVESPFASVAATLTAAGWFVDRAKTYGPQLLDIRNREKDMKRGAGFGIHSFFSAIRGRSVQITIREA
jgi:hypothetical protein